MKRSKGMGVGMVFGIIFAVLVISMLFVFGSDAIMGIFCMGSDAQVQKAIQNMQTFVDDLYVLPSGSGDYFTIGIPKDYKLCFVNSTDPKAVIYPDPQKSWNPDRVYQRIITEEGYNVWYSHCRGESGTMIEHLFINPDRNFCAKPGSRIYLQNVGRWVTIIED